MLPWILLFLALAVVIFLVVAASKPSVFRVERSVVIKAPAAQIFPEIDNLHRALEWSPWMKLDPAARVTFAGPEAGVGASSSWTGKKIGEGTQTISESRADELVRIALDFRKPFKSTSAAEFTLKPGAGGVLVTWAMFGENNFLSKSFCVFLDQDKMCGGPFEKGLAELKTRVEALVPR